MIKWVDLEGKVVIVTGGASGIGRNIAENLHSNNAKVAICDLNKNENVKNYPDLFISCDITKKDSVENMVAIVKEKFGKIEALVNNAGVNKPRLLVDFYEKTKIMKQQKRL